MRHVNISAIGAEAVCKVRRIACTLTTTAGKTDRGAPNQRHGKNKTTPLCEGNRINSRLSGLTVPSGADSRSAQRAVHAATRYCRRIQSKNKRLRAGRRTRGNYIPHSSAARVTLPDIRLQARRCARSALSALSLGIDGNGWAGAIKLQYYRSVAFA